MLWVVTLVVGDGGAEGSREGSRRLPRVDRAKGGLGKAGRGSPGLGHCTASSDEGFVGCARSKASDAAWRKVARAGPCEGAWSGVVAG